MICELAGSARLGSARWLAGRSAIQVLAAEPDTETTTTTNFVCGRRWPQMGSPGRLGSKLISIVGARRSADGPSAVFYPLAPLLLLLLILAAVGQFGRARGPSGARR